MKKHGKKYTSNAKKIDNTKDYNIFDGCQTIKKLDLSKFDESIDLVFNLSAKHKNSNSISGFLKLPHGSNKKIILAVFTKENNIKMAKKYGADLVGNEDLAEKIKNNKNIKIDKVIATPDTMTTVSKLGKILGPKKLMPNPKTGTVTNNLKKAILDNKSGIVLIKTDKNHIIHTTIGKISLSTKHLLENILAITQYILNMKPLINKEQYIKKITISSTMSPSININVIKTLSQIHK